MTNSSIKQRSLSEWVDYVQTLHHREIELSLDRVRAVYQRLHPQGFKPKVVTIAGTNGKGSCAEVMSSIYAAEGYRVGKFTSPHLINFSERYVINGKPVSEVALLEAFEKIECARAEIGITFFEFGALLAIELFVSAQVDIAVMEVGLGGRLDAINILDADVSIITSISKDHTAWLGDTIEKIAYEKSGIARPGRPCVVGIDKPPQSITDHCADIGAMMYHIGRDFSYDCSDLESNFWSWQSDVRSVDQLPLPYGQAGVQLSNASVCLQVVSLLDDCLPISNLAVQKGLANATLLARCQILSHEPLTIVDVAHNQSSVERLRDFVGRYDRKGQLIAVCGMLKDKEVKQSLAVLVDIVDTWHVAAIDHERGASAEFIKDQLLEAGTLMSSHKLDDDITTKNLEIRCYDNIINAYEAARQQLKTDDCLIVFGSFFVAGDILQLV